MSAERVDVSMLETMSDDDLRRAFEATQQEIDEALMRRRALALHILKRLESRKEALEFQIEAMRRCT